VPAHVLKQEEDLVLILGKIDDFDRTYLNGKLIGQTNDNRSFGRSQSFNEQRAYTIPSGLLKAGANVVEVFVQDIGNIGGIYEGPVGIATRTVFQRYYKVEKSLFWDFE
jgi:sialate O-acetylesterase